MQQRNAIFGTDDTATVSVEYSSSTKHLEIGPCNHHTFEPGWTPFEGIPDLYDPSEETRHIYLFVPRVAWSSGANRWNQFLPREDMLSSDAQYLLSIVGLIAGKVSAYRAREPLTSSGYARTIASCHAVPPDGHVSREDSEILRTLHGSEAERIAFKRSKLYKDAVERTKLKCGNEVGWIIHVSSLWHDQDDSDLDNINEESSDSKKDYKIKTLAHRAACRDPSWILQELMNTKAAAITEKLSTVAMGKRQYESKDPPPLCCELTQDEMLKLFIRYVVSKHINIDEGKRYTMTDKRNPLSILKVLSKENALARARRFKGDKTFCSEKEWFKDVTVARRHLVPVFPYAGRFSYRVSHDELGIDPIKGLLSRHFPSFDRPMEIEKDPRTNHGARMYLDETKVDIDMPYLQAGPDASPEEIDRVDKLNIERRDSEAEALEAARARAHAASYSVSQSSFTARTPIALRKEVRAMLASRLKEVNSLGLRGKKKFEKISQVEYQTQLEGMAMLDAICKYDNPELPDADRAVYGWADDYVGKNATIAMDTAKSTTNLTFFQEEMALFCASLDTLMQVHAFHQVILAFFIGVMDVYRDNEKFHVNPLLIGGHSGGKSRIAATCLPWLLIPGTWSKVQDATDKASNIPDNSGIHHKIFISEELRAAILGITPHSKAGNSGSAKESGMDEIASRTRDIMTSGEITFKRLVSQKNGPHIQMHVRMLAGACYVGCINASTGEIAPNIRSRWMIVQINRPIRKGYTLNQTREKTLPRTLEATRKATIDRANRQQYLYLLVDTAQYIGVLPEVNTRASNPFIDAIFNRYGLSGSASIAEDPRPRDKLNKMIDGFVKYEAFIKFCDSVMSPVRHAKRWGTDLLIKHDFGSLLVARAEHVVFAFGVMRTEWENPLQHDAYLSFYETFVAPRPQYSVRFRADHQFIHSRHPGLKGAVPKLPIPIDWSSELNPDKQSRFQSKPSQGKGSAVAETANEEDEGQKVTHHGEPPMINGRAFPQADPSSSSSVPLQTNGMTISDKPNLAGMEQARIRREAKAAAAKKSNPTQQYILSRKEDKKQTHLQAEPQIPAGHTSSSSNNNSNNQQLHLDALYAMEDEEEGAIPAALQNQKQQQQQQQHALKEAPKTPVKSKQQQQQQQKNVSPSKSGNKKADSNNNSNKHANNDDDNDDGKKATVTLDRFKWDDPDAVRDGWLEIPFRDKNPFAPTEERIKRLAAVVASNMHNKSTALAEIESWLTGLMVEKITVKRDGQTAARDEAEEHALRFNKGFMYMYAKNVYRTTDHRMWPAMRFVLARMQEADEYTYLTGLTMAGNPHILEHQTVKKFNPKKKLRILNPLYVDTTLATMISRSAASSEDEINTLKKSTMLTKTPYSFIVDAPLEELAFAEHFATRHRTQQQSIEAMGWLVRHLIRCQRCFRPTSKKSKMFSFLPSAGHADLKEPISDRNLAKWSEAVLRSRNSEEILNELRKFEKLFEYPVTVSTVRPDWEAKVEADSSSILSQTERYIKMRELGDDNDEDVDMDIRGESQNAAEDAFAFHFVNTTLPEDNNDNDIDMLGLDARGDSPPPPSGSPGPGEGKFAKGDSEGMIPMMDDESSRSSHSSSASSSSSSPAVRMEGKRSGNAIARSLSAANATGSADIPMFAPRLVRKSPSKKAGPGVSVLQSLETTRRNLTTDNKGFGSSSSSSMAIGSRLASSLNDVAARIAAENGVDLDALDPSEEEHELAMAENRERIRRGKQQLAERKARATSASSSSRVASLEAEFEQETSSRRARKSAARSISTNSGSENDDEGDEEGEEDEEGEGDEDSEDDGKTEAERTAAALAAIRQKTAARSRVPNRAPVNADEGESGEAEAKFADLSAPNHQQQQQQQQQSQQQQDNEDARMETEPSSEEMEAEAEAAAAAIADDLDVEMGEAKQEHAPFSFGRARATAVAAVVEEKKAEEQDQEQEAVAAEPDLNARYANYLRLLWEHTEEQLKITLKHVPYPDLVEDEEELPGIRVDIELSTNPAYSNVVEQCGAMRDAFVSNPALAYVPADGRDHAMHYAVSYNVFAFNRPAPTLVCLLNPLPQDIVVPDAPPVPMLQQQQQQQQSLIDENNNSNSNSNNGEESQLQRHSSELDRAEMDSNVPFHVRMTLGLRSKPEAMSARKLKRLKKRKLVSSDEDEDTVPTPVAGDDSEQEIKETKAADGEEVEEEDASGPTNFAAFMESPPPQQKQQQEEEEEMPNEGVDNGEGDEAEEIEEEARRAQLEGADSDMDNGEGEDDGEAADEEDDIELDSDGEPTENGLSSEEPFHEATADDLQELQTAAHVRNAERDIDHKEEEENVEEEEEEEDDHEPGASYSGTKRRLSKLNREERDPSRVKRTRSK